MAVRKLAGEPFHFNNYLLILKDAPIIINKGTVCFVKMQR